MMGVRRMVVCLLQGELLLIWALGSVPLYFEGARFDQFALLCGASLSGLGVWLVASFALSRPGPAWLARAGSLQFAACWLLFPLFKVIRHDWIITPVDAGLLAWDKSLWGGRSLPEWAFALESPLLSDLLSVAYFCFYLIVLLPVFWYARRPREAEAQRFFFGLCCLYLCGFAGYLLLPAGGPYLAFPAQFPYPVQGGVITGFLASLVSRGMTGMDVLPSLHTAITLFVTGFFLSSPARRKRCLGWFLLPLTGAIVLATVYLRYHYGIDVLCGLLLGSAVICGVCVLPRKEIQE